MALLGVSGRVPSDHDTAGATARGAAVADSAPPGWCRPGLAVWLVLGVAMASAAIALIEPRSVVLRWMSEDGLVEQATAALYLMAAVLVWLQRTPAMAVRWTAALSLVLVAFAARELDLHKAFTTESVLKVSFYLGDAPLAAKMAALLVVLCVAAGLICVVRRWVSLGWRRCIARREAVATTLVTLVLAMLVAKMLDRSINVLAEDFHWIAPLWLQSLVLSIEETLELTLPLLALLAIAQNHRQAGVAGASAIHALERPPRDSRRPHQRQT